MAKTTKKTTTTQKASKKAAPKKVVKKTTTKKSLAKKTPAKKTPAKKVVAKKTTPKKIVKKAVAKKAPTKKAVAKKTKKPVQISSYKAKKNEKYMSAAMKKHFIQVLIEWREHLREEMQKTFDHLRNKGETFADPVDRASQEEEFAFELRTRDRERKLINKINVSLEQIKQDDYGYCHACGIEIGVKRLEARPTATHCIDCKTLDEIKEKQFGW